jgi:antitoxin (DNA-binding transcriptional repressor) of toxin-antitoxin stability system
MHMNQAYEAPSELRDALDRVARGEEVTITRAGAPVAKLVPFLGQSSNGSHIHETIQRLKQFRKGQSLGGISLRGLIEEGRK